MRITQILTFILLSCSSQQTTYVYPAPSSVQADPVYHAVAQLFIKHPPGEAIGTGFAVHTDGDDTYMITVDHLCLEVGKGVVAHSFRSGIEEREKYTGEVVYTDEENDVCIVRIDDSAHKFRPLRFTQNPARAGDRVYTIGSPSGAFPTKTEGYVVGHDLLGMEPDEEGESKSLLVTSVPAYSGNSGGPVYNERHEVVGMLAATHYEYPHSSISVHAESLLKHLRLYFGKESIMLFQ